MGHLKFCLFVFLICLAGCSRHEFFVTEKSINEGPSDKSFIEGALVSVKTPSDTLLFYKFDILGGTAVFKEVSKLNIGIVYSETKNENDYVVNIGFNSLSAEKRFDTLREINSDRKKTFTNFRNEGHGKAMETSFSFSDDKYRSPVTLTAVTSEEKMMEFLRLFKHEIDNAVNGSGTFQYLSACHLDGYYKSISMTILKK